MDYLWIVPFYLYLWYTLSPPCSVLQDKLFGARTSEQFVVADREYIAFGASQEFGTNALRLYGDLLVSVAPLLLMSS